jgi:hypothetical protein
MEYSQVHACRFKGGSLESKHNTLAIAQINQEHTTGRTGTIIWMKNVFK